MKADVRAQLVLLNKNVDEMIRLVQRATDAGAFGLYMRRHAARLELLRAKLNGDFSELMVVRELANESRRNIQHADPLTEK